MVENILKPNADTHNVTHGPKLNESAAYKKKDHKGSVCVCVCVCLCRCEKLWKQYYEKFFKIFSKNIYKILVTLAESTNVHF